jgi:glutamate synthase domain-containing protein 2
MGADAVALGTAALMAIGCQQYRLCNTGLCPTGVATHDPLLSSRIDIDFSAEHLFNFLEVTKKELETYTRMCGYHQIHDLSLSDLTTHDYNLSLMTGIKF